MNFDDIRAVSRIQTFYENGFSGNQIDVRTSQWEVGTKLILKHPLFGVGLGQFKNYYHHEMHNTILMVLFEFGIIGFIIVLAGLNLYLINLLKSINTLKIKMSVAVVLASYLVMHMTHNYMRERWTWLLVVLLPMLLWKKMRKESKFII